MSYRAADARQQLLDEIAAATDDIGRALTALGEAFERVDDQSGETLEANLFRPVQAAYARARRTHSGFAERHGLPGRTFAPGSAGPPSTGVKGFIDQAVQALAAADDRLATLQDSMMPVDVGDAELRAGLSEVRRTIADLPNHARRFVRVLGR